jgi:hypothetical protein
MTDAGHVTKAWVADELARIDAFVNRPVEDGVNVTTAIPHQWLRDDQLQGGYCPLCGRWDPVFQMYRVMPNCPSGANHHA